MEEKKKSEIVPLNRELYTELSIEELEQRLEMELICYSQCEQQCNGYGTPPQN